MHLRAGSCVAVCNRLLARPDSPCYADGRVFQRQKCAVHAQRSLACVSVVWSLFIAVTARLPAHAAMQTKQAHVHLRAGSCVALRNHPWARPDRISSRAVHLGGWTSRAVEQRGARSNPRVRRLRVPRSRRVALMLEVDRVDDATGILS